MTLRKAEIAVSLLGLAVATLFLPATPAWADAGGSISKYVTHIAVETDGTIEVTEEITYDFGSAEKHGIERFVATSAHYDDQHDRVYPIDHAVASVDGHPTPVDQSEADGTTTLRVGDPHQTVTGVHTYLLGYHVRGVLNHFADHEELAFDAVATQWAVPIAQAQTTVTGPAPITRVACYSGPQGSRLACQQADVVNGNATFAQSDLGNGNGLTIVAAFPVGSVANVAPILVDRHDGLTSFQVTWATASTALGIALVGTALVLLAAWRRGRDRRYVGLLPGLAPEPGEPAVEERKPLTGGPPVSVEFGPPDKLRPGQVGTIVDEKADVVDVTATIVDLAVRGYLHIGQVQGEAQSKTQDWELTKRRAADPALQTYERELFDGLFAEGDTVLLSSLKGKFAKKLQQVQSALYDDVVSKGWYRRSPRQTRMRVRALGVLLLLLALLATGILAARTQVALIGIGLIVPCVVLIAVSGRFPARTGLGSAVRERVLGFRLYIASAEKEQIAFQERAQIFAEFLPYAMVFGLVDHWAGILDGLSAEQQQAALGWYSGHQGAFLSGAAFGAAVNSFATSATGTIAIASASGASGFSGGGASFSGGGFGGGGGGSW